MQTHSLKDKMTKHISTRFAAHIKFNYEHIHKKG